MCVNSMLSGLCQEEEHITTGSFGKAAHQMAWKQNGENGGMPPNDHSTPVLKILVPSKSSQTGSKFLTHGLLKNNSDPKDNSQQRPHRGTPESSYNVGEPAS